jgi:hypothetical protein
LNQDIGPVWNAGKANFSEWDIDVDTLILASVRNLLGKGFELAV